METKTTIRIIIETPNIKIDQDVEVRIKRRISHCVAKCDSLRTIGYSNYSVEESIDSLKENIDIFKRVHIELGNLKKALLSFGWVNTVGDSWEYKS